MVSWSLDACRACGAVRAIVVAVPAGREQMLFEGMARGAHPDTLDVLNHLGDHHPDKQIAKAARTAAHKASSRQG